MKHIMEQIERVAGAIMHNVEEAEEHIEHAHKLKEVCRLEADWYKDMANQHMNFNTSGKALFDKLMNDLRSHSEMAQQMEAVISLYERWMLAINRDAARVQTMISMYNK